MNLIMGITVMLSTLVTPNVEAAFSNLRTACAIDGRYVQFKRIISSSPGSSAISRAEVKLDDEARLFASYNPFYGKGGTVSLLLRNQTISLLIWDDENIENVSSRSIQYKSYMIECKLQ